jgi:hypothetical protein
MENALRDSELEGVNLVNASYTALVYLVQHSCLDSKPIITQMLTYFLQTLEQTAHH